MGNSVRSIRKPLLRERGYRKRKIPEKQEIKI